MRDEDDNMYIGSMPIMYPSTLAKALLDIGFLDLVILPDCLALYWKQLLQDFPDHPLHDCEQQWRHAIPVNLWGDEGTKGHTSWMLFSWKLGCSLNTPFRDACFFLVGGCCKLIHLLCWGLGATNQGWSTCP